MILTLSFFNFFLHYLPYYWSWESSNKFLNSALPEHTKKMQLEKKCICQRECVQVTLRVVSELQCHIAVFHANKQDRQPAIRRGNLSKKSLYRNYLFGRIFIFSRIIDKYWQHLRLVKTEGKAEYCRSKSKGLEYYRQFRKDASRPKSCVARPRPSLGHVAYG